MQRSLSDAMKAFPSSDVLFLCTWEGLLNDSISPFPSFGVSLRLIFLAAEEIALEIGRGPFLGCIPAPRFFSVAVNFLTEVFANSDFLASWPFWEDMMECGEENLP